MKKIYSLNNCCPGEGFTPKIVKSGETGLYVHHGVYCQAVDAGWESAGRYVALADDGSAHGARTIGRAARKARRHAARNGFSIEWIGAAFGSDVWTKCAK